MWNTFGKYATEYKGGKLKEVFNNIVPVGILQRDAVPYISGADIKVPPFKIAIKDKGGASGLIIANNDTETTITPLAGDDHVIARFEYLAAVSNEPEILSIDTAALLATDIILVNISTGPLTIISIPEIDRFEEQQYWMENHLVIITEVDDYTGTPPATIEGTRILINAAGTGIFLGHNYELAVVESGVWVFYSLNKYTLVLNKNGGGTIGYLLGNTAIGYVTLGSTIPHDNLASKSVDDVSASYNHISGTALSSIFLKSNFISIVEYVSDTPPTLAGDDKMYLVGTSGTGDWAGHDLEIAIDTTLGWVFIVLDKDTAILSKENSVSQVDWRVYIAKSDPGARYITLCTTNAGSSTNYIHHKTVSGSGTTTGQLNLTPIDISDILEHKICMTLQAHVDRTFTGMVRQMHIAHTMLMTDDFPADMSGDIYFQQTFYVSQDDGYFIDVDLLCILNFTTHTLSISILDGMKADTGTPQYTDYGMSIEAHIYYN